MPKAYSTRFLLEQSSAGEVWSATVPAGAVWVVKNIDAAGSTSGSTVIARTNSLLWWSGAIEVPSGANAGIATYAGRHVMNAGDEMTISVDAATGVQVSGFSFSA